MEDRIIETNQTAIGLSKDLNGAVKGYLTPDTVEPATAIELVRTIRVIGELLDQTPDLAEYTEDLNLPPVFMAQLLMQNLAHVMDTDRLNIHQKVYWMTVAEHMGPDWIMMFRKVGAFMAKTEDF